MLKHSWIVWVVVMILVVCNVRSLAANKVALLVRDSNSLDADEDSIKQFLISSRIDYAIADAGMIKNETFNVSDYNVMYMRTGSEPTTYNDPNVISKIGTCIQNGGALVLEYFGQCLGSYLSVGTTSIRSWHPVVYSGRYFVENVSHSPIFNNVVTWSPPLPPDDEDQLICRMTLTNTTFYYVNFSGATQSIQWWDLFTTYGWLYESTNSQYCQQHPGLCTPERSVDSSKIEFIPFGNGKIYLWVDNQLLSLVPAEHLVFGRVATMMRKNIISLGGSGCSYILTGDLNYDCKVDIADLAVMAENWLVDCRILPLNLACGQN